MFDQGNDMDESFKSGANGGRIQQQFDGTGGSSGGIEIDQMVGKTKAVESSATESKNTEDYQ